MQTDEAFKPQNTPNNLVFWCLFSRLHHKQTTPGVHIYACIKVSNLMIKPGFHLSTEGRSGTLYVAPAPPWLFPAASCSGALCCSDILLIHCSSTFWQQHTHRQSTIHHACMLKHTHTHTGTDMHTGGKLNVTVVIYTSSLNKRIVFILV